MTPSIACDMAGPVARISLKNPTKRNALDPAMCAALERCLSELEPRGARVAILSGDGPQAFCAGFDIDSLSRDLQGDSKDHPFERLMRAVEGCPVPLVAAIGGLAYGGGLELAASCDLRVTHAEAKMAMPPARLGIVYRCRGLARFSALVGEGRAREIFLTARTFTGAEAAAWGLVQRLVEPDAVLSEAYTIAQTIAAFPPGAVQGTRVAFEALLKRRATLEGPDAADVERRRGDAWRSEDAERARQDFHRRRRGG